MRSSANGGTGSWLFLLNQFADAFGRAVEISIAVESEQHGLRAASQRDFVATFFIGAIGADGSGRKDSFPTRLERDGDGEGLVCICFDLATACSESDAEQPDGRSRRQAFWISYRPPGGNQTIE